MGSSGPAAVITEQVRAGRSADAAWPRWPRRLRLVAPPLAMVVIGLWQISGASYWRDEAATLSATGRPAGALLHMLARTDVVHGVYYLLLLPWARIAGTSALAMRLPSVLGMAAAAAGVAAIGTRLRSERTGLAAGLIFALLPVASRYGQEARSYALVVALAAAASYLLLRGVGEPELARWWVLYAAVLAVMGWMNLMSLLIVPAHAVTIAASPSPAGLATGARRLAVGWAVAVVAAGVAVCPLVVLAWPQRGGTQRFLATVSAATVADLPGRLTGSWPVLAVALPLVVLVLRWSRTAAGTSVAGRRWLARPGWACPGCACPGCACPGCACRH